MSRSQSHRTPGVLVLAIEITVTLAWRQKLCKVGGFPQRFHIITASKIFTWDGGPTGSFKICLVAMEKSAQLWALQGRRS